MPAALVALMICVFTIGTTEYVIAGILPEVAADLGVSVPAAGQLVTAYALTIVVGGPVLTALTVRRPRKGLLLALMALFLAGTVLSAVAPSYEALLGGRIVSALTHGTFFAVTTVVATSMVPPDRAASAIAMVAAGLNLATILGVPLGTYIGQQFGWRATFVVIAALGAVGAAGVAALLSRSEAGSGGVLRAELAVFRRRAGSNSRWR